MKKRVLCLILAVIMVACLLPTAAFASTNGKTADDAINWVRSLNGQPVGSGECVALITAYYSFLGQQPSRGDGKEYWTNDLPAGWTRIPNAQPQKGDILVYGWSAKNPAGHVAIYESDYSTWHQNFSDKRYVVKVTQFRYDKFDNPYLGVIRPDFSSAVYKPDFIDIGTNIYRYIIRADKWMPTGTCYDQNAKQDVKIVNSGSSDPNMIWLFTRMGNDNSYVIQNAYNNYYLCYDGNCASQAKITTSDKLTSRCYWYVAYYNASASWWRRTRSRPAIGLWWTAQAVMRLPAHSSSCMQTGDLMTATAMRSCLTSTPWRTIRSRPRLPRSRSRHRPWSLWTRNLRSAGRKARFRANMIRENIWCISAKTAPDIKPFTRPIQA